jgi:hypothetical protein
MRVGIHRLYLVAGSGERKQRCLRPLLSRDILRLVGVQMETTTAVCVRHIYRLDDAIRRYTFFNGPFGNKSAAGGCASSETATSAESVITSRPYQASSSHRDLNVDHHRSDGTRSLTAGAASANKPHGCHSGGGGVSGVGVGGGGSSDENDRREQTCSRKKKRKRSKEFDRSEKSRKRLRRKHKRKHKHTRHKSHRKMLCKDHDGLHDGS